MPVKVEVYTSPTCPYCPYATKLIHEVAPSFGDSLTVEEIDTWSPEGEKRAMNYNLMAVPTIVINGKVKFVGVPKKEDLEKAIREELKEQTRQ